MSGSGNPQPDFLASLIQQATAQAQAAAASHARMHAEAHARARNQPQSDSTTANGGANDATARTNAATASTPQSNSNEEWACEACTFLNPAVGRFCSMCATPRPTPAGGTTTNAQGPQPGFPQGLFPGVHVMPMFTRGAEQRPGAVPNDTGNGTFSMSRDFPGGRQDIRVTHSVHTTRINDTSTTNGEGDTRAENSNENEQRQPQGAAGGSSEVPQRLPQARQPGPIPPFNMPDPTTMQNIAAHVMQQMQEQGLNHPGYDGPQMFNVQPGVPGVQAFVAFQVANMGVPAEDSGPAPASREFIDNLTEECLDKQDIESGNEQCAICFADQQVGDLAAILPCGHAFHKSCLVPWIERHSNCPVCRGSLTPDQQTGTTREQAERREMRERNRLRREQHDTQVQEARDRMTRMQQDEAANKKAKREEASEQQASSSSANSSSASSSSAASGEDLRSLSVKELKRRLDALRISYRMVTEKGELVKLLEDAQKQ
eukprot:m.196642 g.196642  ORF g.196642 m.196642 type:complete len:488 (-) comp15701_c0_seq3:4304-5767(-)